MEYHYLIVLLYLTTFCSPVISQRDYHCMQYVLQWPPTFCQSNDCKPGIPAEFFIHGLWPANDKGISLLPPPGINSFKENLKVDNALNANPDLENHLKIIWRNLHDGGVDKSFWKYEWRTHGVCSASSINTADYFKAAWRVHNSMIAIKGKKNLLDYMVDAGIKKSNKELYSKTNILRALSALVGNNNVYISCKKKDTHFLLHEVYLCLDKKMTTFKSCPPNSDSRGCDGNLHDNNIMLPG